jgi:hypothetical protein
MLRPLTVDADVGLALVSGNKVEELERPEAGRMDELERAE